MSDETKVWSLRELDDDEMYAFCYATAAVGGPGSRAHEGFVRGNAMLVKEHGLHAAKQKLVRGLKGLMDKRIVECERDGEGDWVPKVLHLERERDGEGDWVPKVLHLERVMGNDGQLVQLQ